MPGGIDPPAMNSMHQSTQTMAEQSGLQILRCFKDSLESQIVL
jgi:hypothetical protein